MQSINYTGICTVHAIYDGIINSDTMMYDFSNQEPQKERIYRGSGFIKIIDYKEYVISCNHIMVENAKEYKAYYKQVDSDILIELHLSIHSRIPELDIIIMNIVSKSHQCKLQELVIDTQFNPYYTGLNTILTSEYNPNSDTKNNINIYNNIDINDNINIEFCTLISKYIKGIPLLYFKIDNIDRKYVKIINQIDIKTINHKSKKFNIVLDIIKNEIGGLSGSIVSSDNKNIGMVCKFEINNKKNEFGIKSIPLFLIEKIVTNSVKNGETRLYGLYFDNNKCDIDYDGKNMSVMYVTKRNCPYNNGKKIFYFDEGDLILSVDGLYFNEHHSIFLEQINMYVPLDTYVLLKLNIYTQTTIQYKIAREYKNEYKIRNYNISGKSYVQMLNINIYENKYIRWKDYIFMELSEKLLDFYDNLGIQLFNRTNIKYSLNGEKIIILINYNKFIPINIHTIKNYKSYVINSDNNLYFYELFKIGNKKVKNIEELQQILEENNTNEQITVTLNSITKQKKLVF